MSDPATLLDVFHQHVADAQTRGRHAVECADEHWTYDDLDAVSTGLALELESRYGSRLTVATIAENLPYTFALHLAVWKLGGIVAPIDYHTPPALLVPMLGKVSPSCVVVPSTEKGTQEVVLDSGFPLLGFTPEETTMAALSQRFMGAPDPPRDPPTPADICIYLFTSSASDVSNIKCVPLTHRTLLVQSQSLLTWNKRTFPSVLFQNLRVLGWGLFSHMLATIDISTHVLLTAGCFIFGQTPSSYFLPGSADQSSRDVPSSMLRAMEKYRPDSVASVPWMFEGIKEAVEAETNFERREILLSTLRKFKLVILGGAPTSEECIRWARGNQIRLVLSIGMTELGGCLFHKVAEEHDDGWLIEDRVLSDAQLTLIDNDGKPHDSEGELYISSKVIARGYLDYHPSPFVVAPDGVITFKTGDRYAKSEGRFKWLGRNDDFILLVSGEMVDPRVLEKTLDASPVIARSCIIGNHFLRGSSQFLCALIELRAGVHRNHPSTNLDISRAIRSVNRELAPPLRINWTCVIVLEDGEHIPINKKGQIWRKKLEALYGNRVASLSPGSFRPVSSDVTSPQPSQTFVRDVVLTVVADALRISSETLELNAESTFAELGMDSSAALVIVGQLNQRFKLSLPRNTCHTHIDLVSLTAAISERLRHVEAPAPTIPSAARLVDGDAPNDVVIVGQAIQLPGDLDTPESFWKALIDMREDLLVPVPQDRWDHASFLRKPGDSPSPGDITFEKAGFVDIATFDNAFFGISSAEAFSVAPAARLVLETTFQALENANIPSSRLKGTATGVFLAGSMDQGYTQLMFASMGFGSYTRFHGTGGANSASCGRLSYLLDVHGPSVSLDTACSSGMVAFDQAVQYLGSGQGETAIICGANTHPWPGGFGFLSAQKMTSPNSRCATFSSEADGYVPSEGAVSLILKTRRAALRDGNAILAAIKATATKHNGRSQGLVAPNAVSQADLQRSLLAAASFAPSDIDFVETHGTGTSLGDLIEIEGLNAVFRGSHSPDRPLILGAAKTAVGHTEVVAGLVGIVKAIKQLSTGKVAGLSSLANGKLNPEIDTALVPLCIPSHLTELPTRTDQDAPHRALVVAYGFAGTLAGTILEAPPPSKLNAVDENSSWMIFTVSAKSLDALRSYLRMYLDFCAKAPSTTFRSICYTSCVGRELYRYRFSCVAKDLDSLVQRLKDRLSQAQSSPSSPNPRILFAFPGQGSQFFGMASTLSQTFSQFKEILTDAATLASSHVDFDVLSLLLGTGQSSEEIDRSAVAQICIFIYQYAVCEFLRRLNVVPNAVMGNSLGEISAAVEAGAMSYELGLQFVVARAKLLSPHPDLRPAGMAAIATTASAVSDYIHDLQLVDRVEISGFVSANTHVVSGDLDAIGIVVSHVKKQGLRATLLNVDQGFHSHCIDLAIPQLEAWITDHQESFRPLDLVLFSSVSGKQIAQHQFLGPRHWVDHARNPVRFEQTASQIKQDKLFKTACILDVGPTPTALGALQSNDMSQATLISSAAKKGMDQELAFLTAIASMIEYGINPDFVRLFGTGIPKTNIPTYPFQRQRHYPSIAPSRSTIPSAPVSTPRDLSLVVDESLYKVLNDHRINGDVVLPGSAMVDFFARSHPKHALDIRFHRPWVLQSSGKLAKADLVAGGSFSLSDGENGDKLCSGNVASGAKPVPSLAPNSGPATTVFAGDDVYLPFDNIQFGPLFRNISSVQMWDDRADGLVVVKPTSNTDHDRIRALDACLHMLGACRFAPPDASGAFLPMALQGFSLHADVLPDSFICRYCLPVVLERNNRVASTAFEVFSHSGDLLASCAKYSVAWIDMSIAPSPTPPSVVFQQVWTPKELPAEVPARKSKLIYFGKRRDWIDELSDSTDKYTLGEDGGTQLLPSTEESSVFTHVLETIGLAPDSTTIILDATQMDDAPDSPSFSAFWQSTLHLMKTLGRSKIRAFRFTVLSTAPVTVDSPVVPLSALGAMIQGMLRVFRTEVGLHNALGIELPGDASPGLIADALKAELHGNSKETMVSYRYSRLPGESAVRLRRFVPELRPLLEKTDMKVRGVAVIVGMGSIGAALGPQMIAAGSSAVVFIGRRPETDEKVAQQLSILSASSDKFAYIQADASDINALRRVLQNITATYGVIKSVLHTAASVIDATIDAVTTDSFDRVLRPKVHGAYNLHFLTVELDLALDSFVLFSSVSVPLGNQGQVAYVAANAFLDSLAAYRRAMGLPGVSLQLGPWESELVENLPASSTAVVQTITHKDGIPLILRALSASPVPVQVIAALDPHALSRNPMFATDSLFAALVAGIDTPKQPVRTLSSAAVTESVVSIVRGVLELAESEGLELNESLSACGIDSIAFGQIRTAVMKQLGVDVPLVYLSDAFSVNDMIGNVQESVVAFST